MFPGADGTPDPATRQPFVRGRARPGRPADRPRRRALLRRPRRRRSGGSSTSTGNQRADRARRRATPTSGAAPLTVAVRRAPTSQRPGPGDTLDLRLGPRRRRRLRRLDRAEADLHLHRRRASTPSGCASPTPAAPAAPTTIAITRGQRRRRPTIDTPAAGTTWKVGDAIAFSGTRHRRAGRHAAAVRAVVDARAAALLGARPVDCHAHDVQIVRRRVRARSPRPTTSIRPISSSS